MAITIPNRRMVFPTTTPGRRPAQAKVGVVNPCPVRISTAGATSSGGPLCEPTTVRAGYFGYNVRADVPAGAQDEEAFAPIDGCIVDGFLGVVPGTDVFVDTTARPDPEVDFSGLTHTIPGPAGVDGVDGGGGPGERIGVGVTTTKIYFIAQ